ncbi:hypothetical protein T265_00027 [Opisthorchis viverrini]|uniref:AIMP2 thioredoxin-like domain-containing protein n=1 Tax=Opisthorchis viverrini TaxID=6198 RepID=A0A075A740_OPIVI|nr:hypothetical protein T265_00027 [Opisthorchis viverrini]KER34157.1 hypothetical protein T265_00027 [Opisthorchis viverrini]
MYEVDRYWKPAFGFDRSSLDEQTKSLVLRLDSLDASVSHLLGLLQTGAKAKPKKPTQAPTKTPQYVSTQPACAQTAASGHHIKILSTSSLAVQANPDRPPVAALLFCHALAAHGCSVVVPSYVHSSVGQLPSNLTSLLEALTPKTSCLSNHSLTLRIVWTRSHPDCTTYLDINSTMLHGEVMLLLKLADVISEPDASEQSELLMLIDALHRDTGPTTILKQLAQKPHFQSLNRNLPSVPDCFLYVTLEQLNLFTCLPSALTHWLKFCSKYESFALLGRNWIRVGWCRRIRSEAFGKRVFGYPMETSIEEYVQHQKMRWLDHV